MTKQEWIEVEDKQLRECVALCYNAGPHQANRRILKRVQKISWRKVSQEIRRRSPEACKSRAKKLGLLRKQRVDYVPNPKRPKPRWTKEEHALLLQLLPPPGSADIVDWTDLAQQIHAKLERPLLSEDDLVEMYKTKDTVELTMDSVAAPTPGWTEEERALLLQLLLPADSGDMVDWDDLAQQIHTRLGLPLRTEDDLVAMCVSKKTQQDLSTGVDLVTKDDVTASKDDLTASKDTKDEHPQKDIPDRSRVPWTPEEDEQMRLHHNTHHTKWHLYTIPGRSKLAVRNRAKRIGLT
jgi:hypothetical protein